MTGTKEKKMKLFSLLFCSFIPTILLAQSFTVTEMTPMPEPVTNNAVCEGVFNGEKYVYSFSGLDSTKTPANSGDHLRSWRYSTTQNLWEPIASLPDTGGKIACAASLIGDTIYITGGYHIGTDFNEYSSNKIHRYVTTTNSYLPNGADIPTATDDHVQVVWRDSLLILITGWYNTSNTDKIQFYNPYTNTWLPDTSLPFPPDSYRCFGASGTIIGDTIYYFGGAKNAPFYPRNQLRIGVINPLNPREIAWRDTTFDDNATGYRMACLQSSERFAFWFGGSDSTYNFDGINYMTGLPVEPINRIISLNSNNNSSSSIPISLPMDLRGVAKTTEGEFFIAGGMEQNQKVSNKCFKLSLSFPSSVQPKKKRVLNNISLYPNPCKNWLRFNKKLRILGYQIFDLSGTVIFIS